jgi:hypothetical protein
MPYSGAVPFAEAVSRRLPTAAARVRFQVRSCGICGGQSGTGAGFLRVLRFPLPIFIPPTAPHPLSIIRCWNNRPNSDSNIYTSCYSVSSMEGNTSTAAFVSHIYGLTYAPVWSPPPHIKVQRAQFHDALAHFVGLIAAVLCTAVAVKSISVCKRLTGDNSTLLAIT